MNATLANLARLRSWRRSVPAASSSAISWRAAAARFWPAVAGGPGRGSHGAVRHRLEAAWRPKPARAPASPGCLQPRGRCRAPRARSSSAARRARSRERTCVPRKSASPACSTRRRSPSPLSTRSGAITQSNASFARMMPAALQDGRRGRGGQRRAPSSPAIVERDRSSALARADEGRPQSDEKRHRARGRDSWRGTRSAPPACSSRLRARREGGGATIYALDTTEQRTLKENFAQSQKMQAIGQLAGGIAHDFNNVLTAIIGYSDLLLANHRPTDPSFQDIMQIKQNANRAAGLGAAAAGLLAASDAAPAGAATRRRDGDLQMLMRRLVGEKIETRPQATVATSGSSRRIVNQFEQVIINLVVNARDAMPSKAARSSLRTKNVPAAECAGLQGGRRWVPGDYVAIAVEDNGHRAFRRTCATRSSSRSSLRRRSARAPASAYPWSTASSSRRRATSSATRR